MFLIPTRLVVLPIFWIPFSRRVCPSSLDSVMDHVEGVLTSGGIRGRGPRPLCVEMGHWGHFHDPLSNVLEICDLSLSMSAISSQASTITF